MKTLNDFPDTVFFVDDNGTWRVYYAVPTFVEACMGRYASSGISLVMRTNREPVEITTLARRFEEKAVARDWAALEKYDRRKDDERKTDDKERKALKAQFVDEVESFLAAN